MIRLLQWIIFGHVHRWTMIHRVPLMRAVGGKSPSTGDRALCVCEHCGQPRKFDLI